MFIVCLHLRRDTLQRHYIRRNDVGDHTKCIACADVMRMAACKESRSPSPPRTEGWVSYQMKRLRISVENRC